METTPQPANLVLVNLILALVVPLALHSIPNINLKKLIYKMPDKPLTKNEQTKVY